MWTDCCTNRDVDSSEGVCLINGEPTDNNGLYRDGVHLTAALARRDISHHMKQKGFGPATLDKSSILSAPIRGVKI